jgi:hypothetical protein
MTSSDSEDVVSVFSYAAFKARISAYLLSFAKRFFSFFDKIVFFDCYFTFTIFAIFLDFLSFFTFSISNFLNSTFLKMDYNWESLFSSFWLSF